MKAKVTVVIEYDLKPEYYPDNCTPEDMISIDEDNFREDIGMLFDFINTEMSNKIELEVEVVKD